MAILFGPDPVHEAVSRMLEGLGTGSPIRECLRVDLKEEAGRRDRTGRVLPGDRENEQAARAYCS